MTTTAKKLYWNSRRFFLKNFIPEFIWPKQVKLDGVLIKIRKAPYSFGTKWILKKGEYEVAERKLIAQIIKPGDIVFEMGGSIGVLTAIMGKLTGPKGKVFSIEASKKLTAFSKKWLEDTGNIHVLTGFAFPVYECKKEISIKSFDETQGSLGGILSFDTDGDAKNSSTDTTIYDIKTISEQFQVMPDILVVDIEGSERMLLEEGVTLPESIKYFLIELHPHIYTKAGEQKIISKIQGKGYKLRSTESDVYLFEKTGSIL